MHKPIYARLAATATLALLATLATGGAAFAAPGGQSIKYEVVSVANVSSDYIDRKQQIGYCKVVKAALGCTITATETVQQTVGLSLGASKGFVSGQLSFSATTSRSVAVSCSTDPGTKAGTALVAYPVGKYKTYKIKKTTFTATKSAVVQTSGKLYAFDPKPNSYACDTK